MLAQTQSAPPPPAAPTPPADVAPAIAPAIAPGAQGTPTPTGVEFPGIQTGTNVEIYQGARAARRELRNQLEELQNERENIVEELNNTENPPSGANRTGLEKRLTEIDGRISVIDQQLAQADAAVARAAALPGATVEPPPPPRDGPPEEVFVLAGIFGVIVLVPLTIAYARRIWRRSAIAITELPKELGERFTRLEQAVDAIAVEVERLGEGQRYMTRVFTEQTPPRQAIPLRAEASTPSDPASSQRR